MNADLLNQNVNLFSQPALKSGNQQRKSEIGEAASLGFDMEV
jgi:hypothetical protein